MNFLWQTDRGLVKAIIIILIALLILGYFGLNIRTIVNSPTFQENWHFLQELGSLVWNNYLKVPVTYLWNLFVGLVWGPAINNLAKMNTNLPALPQVPVPPTVH